MPEHSANMMDRGMPNTPCTHLRDWVFNQLDGDNKKWLADQLSKLAQVADISSDPTARRQFDIAFGMIPRRIAKNHLQLNSDERKHANSVLPHWQPWTWQLDEAARILLIINTGHRSAQTALIKSILRHADLSEQLSIFKGLPLYCVDKVLNDAIGEGLRSNMSDVFEAIAHHNPFPSTEFDEHRFNHMVLKALFIGAPLHPIVGLRERNNTELTRMLLDYASERAAAKRTVNWELWQLAAPNATEQMLESFIPILSLASADRADKLSQKGLTLALAECAGVAPQCWAKDNIAESNIIDSTLSWEALLLESRDTKH